MPKYTFVGPHPRVFTTLTVGRGVTVRRKNGPDPLMGEAVQLGPGDTIVSREPIEHPELIEAPSRPPRMPQAPAATDTEE